MAFDTLDRDANGNIDRAHQHPLLCIQLHTYTYLLTYIHTYTHTHTKIYMHTYICIYIHTAFHTLDRDGNGYIDRMELSSGLFKVNMHTCML